MSGVRSTGSVVVLWNNSSLSRVEGSTSVFPNPPSVNEAARSFGIMEIVLNVIIYDRIYTAEQITEERISSPFSHGRSARTRVRMRPLFVSRFLIKSMQKKRRRRLQSLIHAVKDFLEAVP